MKSKTAPFFQFVTIMVLPIVSVILCLVLKIAQGEKNEEIVIGLMLGMVLDIVYAIYRLVLDKLVENPKRKRRTTVLLILIFLTVFGFVFLPVVRNLDEHSYQSAKAYAEAFLEHNRNELENIATDALENQKVSIREYKKVYEIKYDEHENAVNFEIGSQGMLGGQYWRLVYTEKGDYRGEEETYIFYEEDGNNIAFAEKISENWYFYWIDYDGREDLSNLR